MAWYKVWLVVPGTDGDAENGPCEPLWWNDMVEADSETAAIQKANAGAREAWEAPNWYEPGVEAPSDKEMGAECPVCTGAELVTDAEHEAWLKEQAQLEAEMPPFM